MFFFENQIWNIQGEFQKLVIGSGSRYKVSVTKFSLDVAMFL